MLTLVEAKLVAKCISQTAVMSGIMCDIMENLQEAFPQYDWHINETGPADIHVKEWSEDEPR